MNYFLCKVFQKRFFFLANTDNICICLVLIVNSVANRKSVMVENKMYYYLKSCCFFFPINTFFDHQII